MSDLWGLILDSSTLPDNPDNDLWTHLNNLGAGTGGMGFTVLSDGLDIDMDDSCVELELDIPTFEVDIDDNKTEVNIEPMEFEVEIC